MRESAIIWRCDEPGCHAIAHETDNVSPVAFDWTSLEFNRSSQPPVTVELCSAHSRGLVIEVLNKACQIAISKANAPCGNSKG